MQKKFFVGVTTGSKYSNPFQFSSFHEPIKPFGFILSERQTNTVFVKTEAENLPSTLQSISKVWHEMLPERPFEFTFQDEEMEKLYATDRRFQRMFSSFTGLAIVTAGLGLFDLSAHTVQRRIKEIGIRKVLGSDIFNITKLLSKDFVRMIVIAIVMAFPITWYLMDKWLENFSYRISLSPGEFAMSALIAVLIALTTIGYHCLKAAFSNPIDELKTP